MRRLQVAIRYLELGVEEAQWVMLIVSLGLIALFVAGVLGLAWRVFSCAGGFTC